MRIMLLLACRPDPSSIMKIMLLLFFLISNLDRVLNVHCRSFNLAIFLNRPRFLVEIHRPRCHAGFSLPFLFATRLCFIG